jgi:hypothetical protein
MFVSKAGAYETGAPCSRGSSLTDIGLPWKMLAREKHSSLLCNSVSDEAQKKFYNFDTRVLYYKTFYGRNLRIFVKSYSVCPWQVFPA